MIRIALILATLLGVSQIAYAQQTPKAARKGSAVPLQVAQTPLQVAQTILPPPPPPVSFPRAMPPLPIIGVMAGTAVVAGTGTASVTH